MSIDVGSAVSEAWDRFATQAGVVVIVALAVAGVVQAVAQQDLARAFLEWFRGLLVEARTAENAQEVDEMLRGIDQTLETLALAQGISPGVAALLWLVGFVLSAAVAVVAIDAFARGRDSLSGIDVDGLGRKAVHLVVGWIVIGIAIMLGFVLFVLPGIVMLFVVAFLLPYFPVAVAHEDRGFWSAYGRSYGVARENFFDTFVLVVVAVGIFIAVGFVAGPIALGIGGVGGTVLEELIGAAASVFVLAMFTRAFLAATADAEAADADGDGEEVVGATDEGGEVHEDW